MFPHRHLTECPLHTFIFFFTSAFLSLLPVTPRMAVCSSHDQAGSHMCESANESPTDVELPTTTHTWTYIPFWCQSSVLLDIFTLVDLKWNCVAGMILYVCLEAWIIVMVTSFSFQPIRSQRFFLHCAFFKCLTKFVAFCLLRRRFPPLVGLTLALWPLYFATLPCSVLNVSHWNTARLASSLLVLLLKGRPAKQLTANCGKDTGSPAISCSQPSLASSVEGTNHQASHSNRQSKSTHIILCDCGLQKFASGPDIQRKIVDVVLLCAVSSCQGEFLWPKEEEQ